MGEKVDKEGGREERKGERKEGRQGGRRRKGGEEKER